MILFKHNIGKLFIGGWILIFSFFFVIPKVDRLNNWHPIIESAKHRGQYIGVGQKSRLAHASITLESVVSSKDGFYAFFRINALKGDNNLAFELRDENGIEYEASKIVPSGNKFFKDLMIVYPPLLPGAQEITLEYKKYNNIIKFTLRLGETKED